MGDTGYVFVNEAMSNAINNYFKYKDDPNKLGFNTFDVVVARIIVWLYGELDITNCIKTMNEHGMGGFDMNICKFGYPQEELFLMGGTLAEHCGYRLEPIESFEEVFERVSKKKK